MMKQKAIIIILSAILLVGFSAPIDAQKRGKTSSKRATTTKNAKPNSDANLSADELFDKACDAIEAEDSAKIVKYMTLAAEKGHPQAMCAVGQALTVNGTGRIGFTDRNGTKTKQINKSILRPNGLDRQKGREYLLKVYELGEQSTPNEDWMLTASSYYLARSYLHTNNNVEALKYAKKAIELSPDDIDCIVLLGDIYFDGLEDWNNSIVWYRKGADKGDAWCQMWLGDAYCKLDKYALAAMWYHKAAKQGKAWSLYKLALLYNFGWGVEKDEEQAFKYMKKSAELNEVKAYLYLGWWYLEGVGCQRSKKRAITWLTKAKENFDQYNSDDKEKIEDLLERIDAD